MSENKFQTLSTESGDYQTTVTKSFLDRKKWEPANPKHIYSFMPGSVIELKVKAGDTVRKGDSLMIFKAMKMHNNILAPIDGKIKKIDAEIGVNIPKDTLMIEFE